jgi:hypothetical protein
MSSIQDCALERNTNPSTDSLRAKLDIGHSREWWAAEAARGGTDWPGVVASALAMLTMPGLVPQADRRRRQ